MGCAVPLASIIRRSTLLASPIHLVSCDEILGLLFPHIGHSDAR